MPATIDMAKHRPVAGARGDALIRAGLLLIAFFLSWILASPGIAQVELDPTDAASTSTETSRPIWQFVTIPELPDGASLGKIWARTRNEVYVWANRGCDVASTAEAFLFCWDGTKWTQALYLRGYCGTGVFGVGSADVFADASNPGVSPPRMYRSTDNGSHFVQQVLPEKAAGARSLNDISGTVNNVHALLRTSSGPDNGYIIRFDGASWNVVFTPTDDNMPFVLDVLSATEGYYVGCWGWGKWDGNRWSFSDRQFDFCDIYGTWAIRDKSGVLDWYAVGNNNFSNGIRVWKFDESSQSFGSKFGYVFSDGDGFKIGSANGIWGSAPDDVYVIGGLTETSGADHRDGRVYHYDGAAWSEVTPFPIPDTAGITGTAPDDVWISLLDGRLLHGGAGAWTQLNPSGQIPVAGERPLVYDSAHNLMIAFGGGADPEGPSNLTWVLSNANGLGGAPVWSQLDPSGALPPARSYNSAVYDPRSNRLIIFGGYLDVTGGILANDTWVLTNANGLGGTPQWIQLSPTGQPPDQRGLPTAIYDSTNNIMTVFGGCTRGPFGCDCAQNDTWTLTNANGLGGTPQWTKLSPSGSLPSGRNSHTATYDPNSNGMTVFGGTCNPVCTPECSGWKDDTWVLTDANGLGTPQWIELTPTGGPPSGRYNHAATYDAATNRMTIFAGVGITPTSNSGSENNDTWVLSGANGLAPPSWTQLFPSGPLPAARENAYAVYDAANNRMITFGGNGSGVGQDDTWVLTGANGLLGSTPTTCAGDCTVDGIVTIDEIIALVNIDLGRANVSTCMAGDTDRNGKITIDEILTAVNSILDGCPQ